MPIDPAIVQRVSQSLALAFEQALAPLREEIKSLRGEVASLRAAAGIAAPQRAPRSAPSAARTPAARGANRALDCQVPGCPAPVLAKELCETHYRVMRRTVAAGEHFDPAQQRPAGTRTAARGCHESDCNEPHYAKGLCRRHYMAARARARATESRGQGGRPAGDATSGRPRSAAVVQVDDEAEEHDTAGEAEEGAALLDAPFDLAIGAPEPGVLPTAEVVKRTVKEYRGNYWKVAEKLGRNPQSVKTLLYQLKLLGWAEKIREEERQRIKNSPLHERLDNVLRRQYVLNDLGCLKEVDESNQHEVLLLCGRLAKSGDTQESLLKKLGDQLGLDADLTKRLAKRYNLSRHFENMRLKPASRARVRA
jgi:hypothetical protein